MKIEHVYFPTGGGPAKPERTRLMSFVGRGKDIETPLILAATEMMLNGPEELHGSPHGWNMSWHIRGEELRLYEVHKQGSGNSFLPFHRFRYVVGK